MVPVVPTAVVYLDLEAATETVTPAPALARVAAP